jgi:hypothetical protein
MHLSEALLASLSVLPGRSVELATKGIFIRAFYEPLAFLHPDGCSWNKSQQSFPWMEEGYSDNTSVDWPRSGMILCGIAYPLAPLVRPIAEIDSGLLPTPTKFDATCGDLHGKEYGGENSHAMKLIQALKRGLLPTPNSSADCKGSPKNRFNGSSTERSNLRERLRTSTEDGTYPHPLFVEWMMGFPRGWTVSKAWEMRSSRKSRTSSDKQLTKSKEK